MINKTHGIVARITPFSETSRIVTWLTRDFGKISTIIKGSQRPKSLFLGQYDTFYTCELVFYYHDRDSAFIAKECYPLKPRETLRTNWRAAATASYFIDLIARMAPPKAPTRDLYELIDKHLDYLAQNGSGPGYIFWFELKLLEILGVAPRLQHCMDCGTTLLPSFEHAQFAYQRGGILCARCSSRAQKGARLSPELLGLLLGWQKSSQPQIAQRTLVSPIQLQEIEHILGLFIGYHLDIPLTSRTIALDIVRRVLPQPETIISG